MCCSSCGIAHTWPGSHVGPVQCLTPQSDARHTVQLGGLLLLLLLLYQGRDTHEAGWKMCLCHPEGKGCRFLPPFAVWSGLSGRCREKVIHQVRDCIEEHWMDDDRDFQGEHEKCFQPSLKTVYPSRICHFLPRVTPMGLLLLWVPPCVMAPTGKITSECGEQQGDLLGPLLFSLALHKLVSSIDADDECFGLLLQAWYLDDGVLAGSHPAVLRAVHLLEELGPALGIHINLTKCEFFGRTGNTSFPPSVRSSLLPNLDILGVQIGNYLHCSTL